MKGVAVSVVVVLLAAGACGEDDGPAQDAAPFSCGRAGDQVRPPFEGSSILEGCTWMRGSIHIPDTSDEDVLVPLRTLTRVDGSLTVFRNHILTDMRGLEALETVGGELGIYNDDSDGRFTSLEGLGSVREVGELRLDANSNLQSLDGLTNLEIVFGELRITNNPSLPQTEIDAFLARVDVQGEIVIEGNGP